MQETFLLSAFVLNTDSIREILKERKKKRLPGHFTLCLKSTSKQFLSSGRVTWKCSLRLCSKFILLGIKTWIISAASISWSVHSCWETCDNLTLQCSWIAKILSLKSPTSISPSSNRKHFQSVNIESTISVLFIVTKAGSDCWGSRGGRRRNTSTDYRPSCY